MFNRHGYEEDISEIRKKGVDADLALISADINGLKTVNDKLGHAAGDELIKGAAFCLLSAIGSSGKIYRTGGDEFIAIVHSADCKTLIDKIKENTADWHGNLVKTVSVSVGCATHAEYPDAGIEELERLADMSMYKEKEEFYRQTGLKIR
jgi:diguanylate cyclase (GGDEF)-like protein